MQITYEYLYGKALAVLLIQAAKQLFLFRNYHDSKVETSDVRLRLMQSALQNMGSLLYAIDMLRFHASPDYPVYEFTSRTTRIYDWLKKQYVTASNRMWIKALNKQVYGKR